MKKVNAVSVHTMILNGKAAKSAREHIIVCSRRSVCETKRNNKRRDSHGGVKKRGRFGSSGIALPDPDFPCFSTFRFYCAIYHLVSFC